MRLITLLLILAGAAMADPVKIALLDYAPYSYINAQGNQAGLTYQIISQSWSNTELEVEISIVPWNRMIALLDSGVIDVAGPLFYTGERSKKYNFYPNPLHTFDMVLIQHQDSDSASFTEAGDFKGLTLIKVKNTFSTSLIENAIAAEQLKTIEVGEAKQIVSMINGKRADIGIGDRTTLNHQIQELGAEANLKFILPELQRLNAYMVFGPQVEADIIDQFDKSFLALSNNGTIEQLIMQANQ